MEALQAAVLLHEELASLVGILRKKDGASVTAAVADDNTHALSLCLLCGALDSGGCCPVQQPNHDLSQMTTATKTTTY